MLIIIVCILCSCALLLLNQNKADISYVDDEINEVKQNIGITPKEIAIQDIIANANLNYEIKIPNSMVDTESMFEESNITATVNLNFNTITNCKSMYKNCTDLTILYQNQMDVFGNESALAPNLLEENHSECFAGCTNVSCHNPQYLQNGKSEIFEFKDIPENWGGPIADDEEILVKQFNLLTIKPIIYVANVCEEDYADPNKSEYYQQVKKIAEEENAECIAISANIEAELAELPKEEKIEYLNSLGAESTGLDRLVATTYRLLNLATFFTVGQDEVRAWTFTKGMLAPQCAGTIHSDFERGFIRAEVYSCDDIFEYKSEKALKEAGKIRSEGKSYLVHDGDCMLIRFNV